MVYDPAVFFILCRFSMESSVLSLNKPLASNGSSLMRFLMSSTILVDVSQACLLKVTAEVKVLEATSAECWKASVSASTYVLKKPVLVSAGAASRAGSTLAHSCR